jgi:transposase InsO family protein
VLDGCSRYVVAWDIREARKEADAELVLQRAREQHPQARPQIISDNGPQFVAKDFKEFLWLWQTSHVFTSPHYPQSNGKLERFHRTLKTGHPAQNAADPGRRAAGGERVCESLQPGAFAQRAGLHDTQGPAGRGCSESCCK